MDADERLEKLESLDSLEAKFKRTRAWQEVWRDTRAATWLTPFITTSVLVNTSLRETMSPGEMAGASLGSLVIAFGGFILSDVKRQYAYMRGHNTALTGAQIVEELRMITPNWIQQGLAPDDDIDPEIAAQNTRA